MLLQLPTDIRRYILTKYLDKYDIKIFFDVYGIKVTDSEIYVWAAKKGYMKIMKYYHYSKLKIPVDRSAYWAARNGHFECLRLIKEMPENGIIDPHACGNAALIGDLDSLKYSYENTIEPYVDWVCCNASLNGHLECLKYGHEKGMRWDYKTCSHAALNGHLNCLKYAHENGCEWLCDTIENAYKNNHKKCLRYAIENGCPNTHNRQINDT